jgi:hypothetical protein
MALLEVQVLQMALLLSSDDFTLISSDENILKNMD